jgi:SAM-dependent methyltransferase
MYKELRSVTFDGEASDPYEGIQASTPDAWARNFAASKKLTLFKRAKLTVDKRYTLIKKYFRPRGKILDAGCGFGEWVGYLNEKKFVAAGLDYSATLVGRLKAVYPATDWIYGTVEKIPSADSTYDGLISWGVIEHNEDGPQSALDEFYRVLKPGGSAVVTVPFEDSLAVNTSQLDSRLDPNNAPRAFYCYYMTKRDLEKYMCECGFDVLEIGLCPPAALGKVLPRFYMALNRHPKLRLLLIHLFGLMFFWKTDWYFMMYAVGRKPLSPDGGRTDAVAR